MESIFKEVFYLSQFKIKRGILIDTWLELNDAILQR